MGWTVVAEVLVDLGLTRRGVNLHEAVRMLVCGPGVTIDTSTVTGSTVVAPALASTVTRTGDPVPLPSSRAHPVPGHGALVAAHETPL